MCCQMVFFAVALCSSTYSLPMYWCDWKERGCLVVWLCAIKCNQNQRVPFMVRGIKMTKRKNALTSSPKCFMAYSNTPDAASGCCSLLLMLQYVTKKSFQTLLNTKPGKVHSLVQCSLWTMCRCHWRFSCVTINVYLQQLTYCRSTICTFSVIIHKCVVE